MILVGKDERKKTLGRPRSRSDVSIKINLKKSGMAGHGLNLCVFSWLVVCFVGWLVS
jgi:hypothetical protein